jgi:hypothetical protein
MQGHDVITPARDAKQIEAHGVRERWRGPASRGWSGLIVCQDGRRNERDRLIDEASVKQVTQEPRSALDERAGGADRTSQVPQDHLDIRPGTVEARSGQEFDARPTKGLGVLVALGQCIREARQKQRRLLRGLNEFR